MSSKDGIIISITHKCVTQKCVMGETRRHCLGWGTVK